MSVEKLKFQTGGVIYMRLTIKATYSRFRAKAELTFEPPILLKEG